MISEHTNTFKIIIKFTKLGNTKNYTQESLGGSSPSCAITSITNDIRCTSQTQQIYYGIQGQVNDNIFRPLTQIRPSSGQAR